MADDAVDDLDATLPLAMDVQADFFEDVNLTDSNALTDVGQIVLPQQ